jgi:hypothetical protein
MCTGFERSAHEVLEVFSPDSAVTIRMVRSELGEKRFFLCLGGGNTLSRFVRALEFEGFLRSEGVEGFRLTPKGVQKKEQLGQIVACA